MTYHTSSYARNIFSILKRNRRILSTLSQRTDEHGYIEVRNLQEYGFNFSYHTHIRWDEKGNQMTFCFEYGYIIQRKDTAKIVTEIPTQTN